MKKLMFSLFLFSSVLFNSINLYSQTTVTPIIVSSCGAQNIAPGVRSGNIYMNTAGEVCNNISGSAGAAVNIDKLSGVALTDPILSDAASINNAKTVIPTIGLLYNWNGANWVPVNTTDLVTIVPWPGTLVSGAITSAMTATTSTSLITGTASNYIYITSCTFSNTDADTDTEMVLQDGSGGTVLDTIPVPKATSGAIVTFPGAPLKVPTAGNALFVANVTTGATTKASCNGFRSTVSY